MPVLYLFLDKIAKILTLHAFLGLTVTKLSSLKNSPVFLAHPVLCFKSFAMYSELYP